MRPYLIAYTAVLLLLAGCKKDNLPVNFTASLSGPLITSANISGHASTSFDNIYGQPEPAFEIAMSGPGGSSFNLVWYNLDSVYAEQNITARTYTIPRYSGGVLAPFAMAAAYAPNSTGVYYATGGVSGGGGTCTITGNTGPGGLISGTYSVTTVNTSYPYDSVHVTGSFTNVSVATQ